MKLAVRRTSTAIAAVATAGVSSLFLGVAPASAATDECGATGTLVSPGICEQIFTSGTASFTPTAQMTTLEVLLVGAGGAGADQPVPNTSGYAAAGGGGEVKVVDFSGAAAPLNITVATPTTQTGPGVTGSVTDGTTNVTVGNGAAASDSGQAGGASGNGNPGAEGDGTVDGGHGGGGGAAGSPDGNAHGGAGVIVNMLVGPGSLFSDDTDCYGGGGAIGTASVQGFPGCGGGGPADDTGTVLSQPAANSGGGGGGSNIAQTPEARAGATGLVAIRWNATVTLTFDANGHGTAPAAQAIPAGTAAARPVDPTAAGYEFQGWYTDAELTIPADFTATLSASTTYYAGWTQVLPETGSAPSAAQLPIGLAALLAGAGLVAVARRRVRAID